MFKPNFLFILAIIFLIGLDNARSSPLKKNTPASPEDKTAAAADLDDESAYDDEEETKATADDKNNSTTATADIKKETTAATTVQSARTTATVDETVSKSNTADPSTSTVMHLFPHKATASTNTKLSESDEDYQYKDLPEKSKPKTVMKNPILSDEGEEAAPPAGDAAEAGAAGADGAAAAGAEGAAGAAAGNGTAGAAGDGGGGGGAAGNKDVTPSGPPKFFRDHMGNWVYNLWGATLGKVGQDSRYPEMRTIEHFKIDSNAAKKYYPDGELATVCKDSSTIYNVPRVKNWIARNVYSKEIKGRPIWNELRRHIYTKGNSEECHDSEKFGKWRDYQECAIRRNMRLEHIIPMYPMHQMRN